MSQLPAHLQRFQSRGLSKALSQNLGAASPPHVSIAGGRFTLIDAAGNQQPGSAFDQQLGVYLDACIIDANDHVSRVYYATDYDPSAQNFSPPDCWSDNGVGPSVSCSKPQSPTCAACPNAVWGSAVSAQGKAIPACQMVQKLALIVPQHPNTVFLLRVPPNSHKNLRSLNEKTRANGVDLSDVITRIHFDRTTQGTLLFYATGWIDEQVAQLREAAYVEKKTDTIVGRTDVARPALAAPAQTQQIAPPVQPNINQAGMGDLNQPLAAPGPFVQPAQTQQPMFAQAAASSTPPQTSVSTTVSPGATTAPPSEAVAPQRRRRRVASEAPAAEQVAPATVPPNAPFPHGGQTANALPNVAFGMAEGAPAGENAEVANALNNFFGN